MPSVGFTISQLKEGLDPESPKLMEKWRFNKGLFESFFGQPYPLVIYRGADDKRTVVALGPFADPAEHLEEFAHSEEMGDYLDEFGDILDLRGAFHIEKQWEEVPIDKKYVSIFRYFVDEPNKAALEKGFNVFAPRFLARNSDNAACSAWRTKGGWRDLVAEDDSKALAGVNRDGIETKVAAAGDEEGDDGTCEWICFFGWGSKDDMDKAFAEMQNDYDKRDESWQGLKEMVAASKQVTIRNFVRIDYEENDKKNGV